MTCAAGHEYPFVDGIPVLVLDELEPTQPGYWATQEQIQRVRAEDPPPGEGVDPYVSTRIAATHGRLYSRLSGDIARYPIPDFPLGGGTGRTLVDIGCNWGRWTLAAAIAGFDPVGIDPSFEAISAACRIARQLVAPVRYAVADARALPFPDRSVDVVFSYSVLQHFSRRDVRAALEQIARVLRPGGEALIQMANAYGLWNGYRRARRRVRGRGTRGFDVRYWTPAELRRTWHDAIGPAQLRIDGFFSLNPRPSDLDLLPPRFRALVRASEALRQAARVVPGLGLFADSVYVRAIRRS